MTVYESMVGELGLKMRYRERQTAEEKEGEVCREKKSAQMRELR